MTVKTSSLLLLATALACGGTSPVEDLDPQELLQMLGGPPGHAPLVLDVRTPEEYGSGHVPGARNIPHDLLSARLGEIDAHRGRPVVVYCERGGRARKATEVLADAGFTRILHLDGDMAAWRDAGLPQQRGAP